MTVDESLGHPEAGMTPREICERDGWVCQLCGVAIPPGVPSDHLLAGTMDHIIPQRNGGTDEAGNLQAAHRRCNSSKGASPYFDPADTAGGSIEFGITSIIREERPDLADKIDLIQRGGKEPVEVPLPLLTPDEVGSVFDQASQAAEQVVVQIINSSELRGLIRETIDDSDDAEEAIFDLPDELMRVAQKTLINHLQSEVDRVVGLTPIWGLSPFHEHEWDKLADRFLGYAMARDRMHEAIESIVVSSGLALDSVYVSELRIGQLIEQATAAKKAGRLEEAERLFLETITLAEQLAPSQGRDYPSPRPYEQVAIIRRKLGDPDGGIAILERFEAQVRSRADLSNQARDLLAVLSRRRGH